MFLLTLVIPMNKKEQLNRLRRLQDKPKEGESILYLKNGAQVVVPSMVNFAADCLYGSGASGDLFKQVTAIDEGGDSRLGELLAMVIEPGEENNK